MNRLQILVFGVLFVSCAAENGGIREMTNVRTVAETAGLAAFWDFDHKEDNRWASYYDQDMQDRSFAMHLKRIGDPRPYSINDWPYTDANSKLVFDRSGPFGKAIRFNQGYIFGEVARSEFDGTLLDIHGRRPFTIIAWVKFIGERHLVAGIWDEGGWDKYAGRRQIALFAGLFGQKGAIMHVSATGAASYPQSTISGSQYARCRAIDGQPFENDRWVAMAATYDPAQGKIVAFLNGKKTPHSLTDPVAQDVYRYDVEQLANPFDFPLPIYSPGAFVLKYNGYDLASDGIAEHRLHVDLDSLQLTYEQDRPAVDQAQTFRLLFDITHKGTSILESPVEMNGLHGEKAVIPVQTRVTPNDEISTRLEILKDGGWVQIGTTVTVTIQEGAPFTFGRALGLGSEEIEHGSQLFLDGVAVFDRVLTEEELRALSFVASGEE